MRLYDLPDVIIDYIYSFDDNYFYRKQYNNALAQMLLIRERLISNIYLSSFHSYYNIYCTHMIVHGIRKNQMSISQYIFESHKQLGIQVILDSLSPTDITKSKCIKKNENNVHKIQNVM